MFQCYTKVKLYYSKIHIYGLSKWYMKLAYDLATENNIELSVDSTKWTKPCTKELKLKYGLNCNTNAIRQIFFNEYLRIIKKSGINVIG